LKAEILQPVSAQFDFGNFFLAVFVNPCLRLNFQAAHIGAPDGLSLAGSHNFRDFIKRPGGAANQQENLHSTGLTPALRQALSLVSEFDKLNIEFLLLDSHFKYRIFLKLEGEQRIYFLSAGYSHNVFGINNNPCTCCCFHR
jgi:hypothetical protein